MFDLLNFLVASQIQYGIQKREQNFMVFLVAENLFNERLWRSVKYEEVYLHEYTTVKMATERLGEYFDLYNHRRLHSALGYVPPAEIYFKG